MSVKSYDPVWEALKEGLNVLILVDHLDDEMWELKTSSVKEWIKPLIEHVYGPNDFVMKNGTWLCLRKLREVPGLSTKHTDPTTKIMHL